MNRHLIKTALFITLMCLSLTANAQNKPLQLTAKEISQVIESTAKLLNNNYVYPDKAEKIAKQLKKNLKRGAYKKLTDPMLLAEKIQQDLVSVVDDTHLIFEFNPDLVTHLRQDESKLANSWSIETQSPDMHRFNYGFESVKMLEGNIGYIKINNFFDTEFASETATGAMNFLSNSDAIIFDLRQNSGGNWRMVQLISSYLFDTTPVHLSGFYWRPEDKHTQNWTLPYVPGKRNPNAEVFILTSANTHSAAEEFTYNLKHLKKATVIGEVTMGGAHPGIFKPVNDLFALFLPIGKSTNPITHTNWEGKGVQPHIAVPAADALTEAKVQALEKLSNKYPDMHGELYRWYLISEKAKRNPVELDQKTLESYTGTYGPRTLLLEGNDMYYQRAGGPKLLLNALESDLFELDADNSFRMRIIKEDGKVTALQGIFDNGFKDIFSKQ
ncbi:S41 family peptidase [Marinicella rhabdoformis]|uniref:S41 family peptidase n=1 Tax=Marinicella rhabdoformis TaxID=2580566 RepID=UPI0012AEC59C|nr:S41 family peptidase [Marinicella rhabdoformis]